MDVSRIEAFNPNKIPWDILTARDILKYNAQGVKVPDKYLQWANEFLNSLEGYRKDDVNYSQKVSDSRHAEDQNSVEGSNSLLEKNFKTENKYDLEVKIGEESDPQEEYQKAQDELTAKEKRKELENDGVSIFGIGNDFRSISDAKSVEAEESYSVSNNIKSASSDSIAILQSAMDELMSRIDEDKIKITDLTSKEPTKYVIDQINQLQTQIRSYGITSQTVLGAYGTAFSNLDSILTSQFGLGDGAIDYGNETVDIGSEIKQILFHFGFGASIEKSGENAVKNGEMSNISVADASLFNAENIEKSNSYSREIQEMTGVDAQIKSINGEKTDKPKADKDKSEDEKEIKTAQNDGSDDTDKLHINIDEILKRKIRKGIEESSA